MTTANQHAITNKITSILPMLSFIVFIIFLSHVSSQIPCDDAYGSHCADKSGWEAFQCVKSVPTLSNECLQFLGVHDACKEEIDANCKGNEFTGDLLPCLSEWTSPSLLGLSCKGVLPKKKDEKKDKKKLTKEEEKKANERRRYGADSNAN